MPLPRENATTGEGRGKAPAVWLGAALLALTIVTFWPVADNGFVGSDDNVYLVENHQVRRGLGRESLVWALSATRGANWHPLTWISHLLDVSLFGLDPVGHHLVSLGWHAASVVLLFSVLAGLTGSMWKSAFVAALFAIHPLHVESVAWAAERKDVLSGFFWFLTLAAYLRHVRRPQRFSFVPVILASVLGLLSKPMVVTLPFVLMLLDWWPLDRFRPGERGFLPALAESLREKLPLFVFAALASVVAVWVQVGGGTAAPLAELPLGIRVANAVVSYGAYIGKLFWPAGLAVVYPYHTDLLSPLRVGATAVALLGATWAIFRAGRSHRYLAVGWLWYLGTLVPVIGLVQVGAQALADRYTYLPLVGLFIALTWGAAALTSRSRTGALAAGAAGIAVVAAFAVTSRGQVRVWHDGVALFGHAARVVPRNHLAENSLGVALATRGRSAEAIGHYEEALRHAPDYAVARYNYGVALAALGRHEEALRQYQEALRIQPRYAAALNNLGAVYLERGQTAAAAKHFESALASDPDLGQAHVNLGAIYAGEGRHAEALSHFEKAFNLGAIIDKESLVGAGLEMSSAGRWGEAAELYRRALAIDPNIATARTNLGVALFEQGRIDEAEREYREALRIAPGSPTAHNNLGNALAARGQTGEALSQYAESIRLRPDYAEAFNNRGVTLFELGRVEEAVADFTRAVQIDPNYAQARSNLEQARLRRVP